MISLMRPAPTLFFAASLTLYQVPQRRLSNLKERSLELMKTSFHSSVLSTEYCSTKPTQTCRHHLLHVSLFAQINNPFALTSLLLLSTRWQCQIVIVVLPTQSLAGEQTSCSPSIPPLVTYNSRTGIALTEHLCK